MRGRRPSPKRGCSRQSIFSRNEWLCPGAACLAIAHGLVGADHGREGKRYREDDQEDDGEHGEEELRSGARLANRCRILTQHKQKAYLLAYKEPDRGTAPMACALATHKPLTVTSFRPS